MVLKQMDLFLVIAAVCVLPILVQSAPESRLIDQVNSLRTDVSYIFSDISTLFKSVENMNKTILSKDCEKPMIKRKMEDEKDMALAGKLSNGFGSVEIMALLEAFESEKRLNRYLQSQLNDVKNGLEAEQMVIHGVQERLETVENWASSLKAERLQFQQLEDRLEAIKAEARQNNEQLNKQHHHELDAMKEVEDNVTAMMEASDCQCKQTTTGTTESADQNKEQEITTTVTVGIQSCERLPSGVHDINFNFLESTKTIYCDGDIDGGGWIVIMRRQDGSVDFDRKWAEYKNGFGSVTGEFWIGNDFIHELTKSKPMELRIDMEDIDGNKAFAKYDVFKIGSEVEGYVLTFGGYSGTAGDSLEKTTFDLHSHNGMRFTTIAADNDGSSHRNCASDYTGGWWYNNCFASHLTGTYMRSHSIKELQFRGIIWESWLEWNKPLTFVEMKVR